VFEKENNKEKYLRKLLDRYVNKDQNQFFKDILFFDFFNTLKTKYKIKILGSKTSFKLAAKHLKRWEE